MTRVEGYVDSIFAEKPGQNRGKIGQPKASRPPAKKKFDPERLQKKLLAMPVWTTDELVVFERIDDLRLG